MPMEIHNPALLHEVIQILDPRGGEFFVDGTINGGGHALEIVKHIAPNGTLLGIDWDVDAIANVKQKFTKEHARVILINDTYARLPEILREKKLPKVDALLLDLGFSSNQIGQSGRGFSFLHDELLLMTYSDEVTPVHEILREVSEAELIQILRTYGEERFAPRIARAIKEAGRTKKIQTSGELAKIISSSVPPSYRRGRIPFGTSRNLSTSRAQGKHPATRTFQALRIYANHELENIENILKALPRIMNHNGRVAIISFHSLEDRIVKTSFKQYEKDGVVKLLTKKPITPTVAEIRENPRSRSAKLRAITYI